MCPRRRSNASPVRSAAARASFPISTAVDQEDECLHRADGEGPLRQEFDRPPSLQLGAQLESRRGWQPDQICEQRHRLRRGESAEPAFDLPELLGRRVLGCEREALRHERDERMERRARGVRRRTAFEPRMREGRKALAQLVDEPRLADPRFAEDDDVLPRPLPRLLPALDERGPLGLAAHEGREPPRRDREAGAHPARSHDAIERHRLAHALERLRATVLDHEDPGHEALRRGRDDDGVGFGRALHARGDVRRLTEDLAVIPNHHGSGVHADPQREACPVAGAECGVEGRHRLEHREARADGAFGIVLAGARPAKIDEEPIAEILSDVAAPARHGAGGSGVVLRQDIPPVLGVELLREWRRADEIAEEDRQLAAFAGARDNWSG